MNFIKKPYSIFLLLVIIMAGSFMRETYGQRVARSQNADSLRMVELYDQARSLYSQDLKMEALNSAEQALQYSMRIEHPSYEIRILEIIGDIHTSIGGYANSIPYFLRTANLLELSNDTDRVIKVYEKIAVAYQNEQVYEKEYEYYEKAFKLATETEQEDRTRLKETMAVAAFNSGELDRSGNLFQELETAYPGKGSDWLRIKNYQLKVYDASSDYKSALSVCMEMLPLYKKRSEASRVFRTYNNIGYYQTLIRDYRSASESYLMAIESGNQSGADAKEIALMMTNAGICFQNMDERKRAIDYFRQAIQLLSENEYYAEKSRVENMLATIYFKEGDLYNAGQFSLKALGSAQKAGNPLRESEAYLTYSQVLREGNDPINALENYEKYLTIRDSLSLEKKIAEQELEKRRFVLEKEERDLKLRLKEEEVSELAITQLMLQNEKIEQEKALLMNETNLQQLEQERLEQDNLITRQKYEAARRERERELLEKEKSIADSRLEIEVQKQQQQQQEILLLEQQQQLDQLELDRQKSTKRTLLWISSSGFLIAFLILTMLISTRRKKQLLSTQKREIEEKNADLEQKNEEISTQRDEIEAQRNLVFEQKEAIELYNVEIMKSIEYARRIQSSTLPDIEEIREVIPECFVLFRPRDVVSGDFYWHASVEGKSVLAVADSTGHGVPGAFMSVMGVSLLKELVQKEYLTHPGVILRRMRKEIINTMGQKGVSGEQRDGYDIALITIDHEEGKLDYAGAYNSLYLIREKSNPPPELEEIREMKTEVSGDFVLYEINADKMPIAHYDRMDKFTNKEFKLFKGDMLYLFTDGYADQFGGEKGKKLMYKPFKRMMLNNAQYPMDVQYKKLNDTLDEWMGMQPQVDDICVMGIKI